MTTADTQATWAYEDDGGICLSGHWNLLIYNARWKQLRRELGALASPREYRWNLRGIGALDSGGALLLWHLWDRQWPRELECSEEHRRCFDRVAQARMPEPPAAARLAGTVEHYAEGVLTVIRTVGGILLLIGQILIDVGYCFSHPRVIPWREISATVYRTGATSMPLLGAVGFTVGVVATLQVGITLLQFGAVRLIVDLMALAVLRELGPVITAIILAGRAGSAMTAQIGAMRITEEFDALRAFGASPSQRLVLPRVIGMALSMPLLVVWTDFTTLLGAAFMSQWYLGVGWQLFLEQLPDAVPLVNFWMGLGKGVLFGYTIALISTYFGLASQPNTDSLSRHITGAVVTSLALILLLDAVVATLLANVGL